MKKLYAALLVFFFVFASTAFAAPFNTRPLGPGQATLVDPDHTEQTLGGTDGIFDDIGWTAGADDPFETQSNAAIFTNMGSGGAIASFIIAIAGNAPDNTVGLYQYGNTDVRVPIFGGVSEPGAGTQATVAFGPDGKIKVTSTGFEDASGVVEGLYKGFGNQFGFYISGPGGTFFTLDSDNPGGAAQALVYQGDGSVITVPGFESGPFGSSHWIFAFEDVAYEDSDKDFNDHVFIVESIVPVPEPGTLLLLGLGLLGLAGVARRKN